MEKEIPIDSSDTFSDTDASSINSVDFYDLMDTPGMINLEVVKEEDEKSVKRDSRGFLIAGILSMLAGAGIMVATNLNFGWMDLIPILITGGIAALGFGLIKGFRKIFRRKNLNLPSLKLLRKVKPKTDPKFQVNRRGVRGPLNKTYKNSKEAIREIQEAFKGKRLGKSFYNKVFMGVAGGLAEYAGINASLVRLFFIIAFFVSGGTVAIIYILLGLLLPENTPDRLSPRGRNSY